MNRTCSFFLLVLLLAWMPACGVNDHSHDDADPPRNDQGSGRPTVAVTHWTDRTELFMEYPVFVAGDGFP